MPSKGKRALVVDDDPGMRDLVASILEEGGFECQVTETATEAHRQVEEQEFDLLIIDRKLPDTDGVYLLRQIRARDIVTPAIIITAHPSVDTAAEALRWEAYDYLVKPFDAGELLEKAQRAIGQQSLVDENLYLWKALEEKYSWQHILSRNAEVQQTYVMAAKAAGGQCPGVDSRGDGYGQGVPGPGNPLPGRASGAGDGDAQLRGIPG